MSELIGPAPAPGEDVSAALALVNTEIEPLGEKVDLVPGAPALAEWLRAHGLPAGRGASISADDLDRMRQLRSAIRMAFSARVAGRRPSTAAMETINGAAALVPSMPRLRWSGGRLVEETVWADGGRAADVAFAAIAANAISMLLGDRGDRLRLCEAHGCNRMFMAEHRRRRWCSRTCGDRVRVARHYSKRDRSA